MSSKFIDREWPRIDLHNGLNYRRRRVSRVEYVGLAVTMSQKLEFAEDNMHILGHGVADQGSAVAATREDPRRLTRSELVAAGHRELDVLREVDKVVDRLLHGVDAQALHGQVWHRVGVAEETVLQNDRSSVEFLCDLSVDRRIR